MGIFRQHVLTVPVIVVGNLIVGGAGKTPTVIALVKLLRQSGFHPGVILRGYRNKLSNRTPQEVKANDNAYFYGDEPVLIAKQTEAPVFFSKNRALAGQALLKKYPHINILVADDGLQHYQLKRNFEIIVLDHRLHGNGYMLPAGPLREPASRRCDAIVLNHVSIPYQNKYQTNVFQLKKNQVYAWHLINPTCLKTLETFQYLNILAIAGIGAPEKFFNLLKESGLEPNTISLPDHYSFKKNFFLDKQADIILITEKDAVKCLEIEDHRVWVVRVISSFDSNLLDLISNTIHEQKNSTNTRLPYV